MITPNGDEPSSPFSGRAAFAISQSYYYVAAVAGVAITLGGTIAALIALRQWVLPSSDGGFGGGVDTSRDAARTFLGALAFVVPGVFVFLLHIREARRRERAYRPGTFWGSALYFHLVALVSLLIALGGAISALHSLVDAALPYCYGPPVAVPSIATPAPGTGYEVSISPEATDALSDLQRNCYPEPSDALRSAVDATIVTVVAGAVWWWHLRRGRREFEPPPPVAAGAASEPPPAG